MDRLSYYDTLANVLPGLICIWALPNLGPFRNFKASNFFTGNAIVDSFLVLALSYVTGHLIQFAARYTSERVVKKVFWHGHFFSDIFLVAAYNRCPDVELRRYVSSAESSLGFPKEDLQVLTDPQAAVDDTKRRRALGVSHAVYRAIDAKTQDRSIATKAHVQNTFYSLFKNLSALFFLLALANLIALALGPSFAPQPFVALAVVDFGVAIVFLVRAKDRGELYVRGLFWSFA